MLLDPLIIAMCAQMSLNSPTGPSACNGALNAASSQTQTTATMNLLESYSKNLVEGNVNKEILYPAIAIAAGIDAYNKKQLTAQFPLKPVIDEVGMNLTSVNQSWTLKWVWKY